MTGKIRLVRQLLIMASMTALVCLTACTPRPRQMSLADIESLAGSHGYITQVIHGGCFDLLTVSAKGPSVTQSKVLRVYIEGDGLAWRSRHHLSADPTPVNPLSLRLMLADPLVDKLYIARPCQFIQTDCCRPRYWSTDRYHGDIVMAVSEVLSAFMQLHGYTQIELVGYSGGATVALLLAAGRDDVLSIRTVSGNLDPVAFCRLHHVTPLSGSLNPRDFTESLQSIPQLHFIGSADSIVPIDIFKSYISGFSETDHIRARVVPGAGHSRGWIKLWGDLVQDSP